MATNHMATNPFPTGTLTSRLLHPAGDASAYQGQGGKASSEGTSTRFFFIRNRFIRNLYVEDRNI